VGLELGDADVDREHRQTLREIVVKLAGEQRALLLVGAQQALAEVAQRLLRHLALAGVGGKSQVGTLPRDRAGEDGAHQAQTPQRVLVPGALTLEVGERQDAERQVVAGRERQHGPRLDAVDPARVRAIPAAAGGSSSSEPTTTSRPARSSPLIQGKNSAPFRDSGRSPSPAERWRWVILRRGGLPPSTAREPSAARRGARRPDPARPESRHRPRRPAAA
jgi:hypothetical protein